MYKNFKKLFATLLICTLIVTLIPMQASAASLKSLKFHHKTYTIVKGYKLDLTSIAEVRTSDNYISSLYSCKKVTYKSSNTKVAKVSTEGLVTGVKKGSAKITIKADNKAAAITVNVIDTSKEKTKLTTKVLDSEKKLKYYSETWGGGSLGGYSEGYYYKNKSNIFAIQNSDKSYAKEKSPLTGKYTFFVKGINKTSQSLLTTYVSKKLPTKGAKIAKDAYSSLSKKKNYELTTVTDGCLVQALVYKCTELNQYILCINVIPLKNFKLNKTFNYISNDTLQVYNDVIQVLNTK